MHFRNRDFLVALDRSAVTANPGLYVSTGPGPEPQRVASQFIQELICRHVAWRVKVDLDLRHGRTRAPLAPGQLYRFALDLSGHTFDNGYIAGLSPADRNRQVAIWMRPGGDRLFHDDPARNAEVKTLFEGEFLLAQSTASQLPAGAWTAASDAEHATGDTSGVPSVECAPTVVRRWIRATSLRRARKLPRTSSGVAPVRPSSRRRCRSTAGTT
jgi:hypothetical protein